MERRSLIRKQARDAVTRRNALEWFGGPGAALEIEAGMAKRGFDTAAGQPRSISKGMITRDLLQRATPTHAGVKLV